MPHQQIAGHPSAAILVLVTLLAFGGPQANAQTNYLPGTVITSSGDSLSGLIDFQEWNRSPKSIGFKLEAEEEPVEVTPHTARAIYVSSEKYVSRAVNVDQLPVEFFESAWAGSATTLKDTVFLAVLVTGPLTLYHYGDTKDHFYVEADSVLEELIYHRRIRFMQGQSYLVEETTYQDQLAGFLEGCPDLESDVKLVRFTRKSLMRVSVDFNECVRPGSTAFVRSERRLVAETGIVLALARSNLSVQGNLSLTSGPRYTYAPDFAASTSTAAGMSLTIKQARNRQKYSFRGEILWVRYRGSASDYAPGARVRADYMKLVTMVRYTYQNPTVRPFVEGGLTNGWAVRFRSSVGSDGSSQSAFMRKVLDESSARRYELGVTLGIGAEMGPFQLQLRLERSNGFVPFGQPDLSTRVTSLYAVLGYRLGGAW